MIQAQEDSVLETQIDKIQKDRPMRLAICFGCVAAFEFLSPNLALSFVGVFALLLDLAGIRLERRITARRSYRQYLYYCGLQGLCMSVLVVFFSLRTSLDSPGQGMVAEAVLWVLLMGCLVRRSGKVYLMVASCLPIGIGLLVKHLLWSTQADGRETSAILTLLSLTLFLYAVGLIWQSMVQASEQVSDRMRADRAASARSRFFATVNHEIRTPLNGILGMAQIIQSDANTPEQQERARSLAESTLMLKALTDDLLDHAKLSAGQFVIKPETVQLEDLIDSALGMYRDLADKRGLSLAVDIKADVPRFIWVDPVRLRQVLCNLISNALKHTEIGGVKVRASAVNRGGALWLVVAVDDTGCGIPANRTETIFAPFEQLDDAAARAGLGTGLGLSIALDLTKAMGGTISVKSESGVGSSFRVAIPIPKAVPAIAPLNTDDDHAGLDGFRVMVVDDSRINRLVARTFLEQECATVVEASDGLRALALLRSETVDVVVMDLNMPRMNGTETLQRIRSIYGANGPRVVMLTASDAPPTDLFDAIISKPLERRNLVQTLQDVTRRTPLPLQNAS